MVLGIQEIKNLINKKFNMKITNKKFENLMNQGKVYSPILESREGKGYWAIQLPILPKDLQGGREFIPKNYFGFQKIEIADYKGINGEIEGLDLYWKL